MLPCIAWSIWLSLGLLFLARRALADKERSQERQDEGPAQELVDEDASKSPMDERSSHERCSSERVAKESQFRAPRQ